MAGQSGAIGRLLIITHMDCTLAAILHTPQEVNGIAIGDWLDWDGRCSPLCNHFTVVVSVHSS